jgi:hypothetical protein
MAGTVANKARFELSNGRIDFATDTFKIILMASGFIFDPDTHHGYADVSASELAAGNGYTTGGNTLSGVSVTEDDTADRTKVTWANTTWTATGGDIGPTPGAIIYDDTATAPQADTLIGYIDFGTEATQFDGGVATIANITVLV